jgi:hypothetical protein
VSIFGNLFMYRSAKSSELYCFSADPKGVGLPEGFSPWTMFGVVRPDQVPPYGLSRKAIEAGISANGFQLWRQKKKAAAAAPVKKRKM